MNEVTGSPSGDVPSIPADYPGRVTRFAPGTEEIVFGLFGSQSPDRAQALAERAVLDGLLVGEHGPVHREYAGYIDPQGAWNEIVLAYWTTPEVQHAWWRSAEVQAWWASDPSSAVGRWREVLRTTQGRHQYASGQETPAGPSAFLGLTGSDKFGFKGAYRARLDDSAHDDFESSVEKLAEPRPADALGRRLSVDLPDNLCFIREGQTWDLASPEELEVWTNSMEKVIDGWVGTLRDDPVGTGCISIRDCREEEDGGSTIDRRSQFAFLLSLGHIERAARSNPAHLRLMGAFNRMYADLPFAPKMNIWVEVHIVKDGGIDVEYVNCHGSTGFLPFFPTRELKSA